jgi:hypothetical protein
MKNCTEKVCWDKLTAAATSGDVAAFHELYAEYLESRNLLSPNRRILHAMSQATKYTIRNLMAENAKLKAEIVEINKRRPG